MDFRSVDTIVNKFNDATYEVAMLIRAERNGDEESVRRHKANAGRILYESFEAALKNHIWSHCDAQFKRSINDSNIDQLYNKFEYCKAPLYDDIEEDVDLHFFKKTRTSINKEKHEAQDVVKLDDLKKYIFELRKFILTYILESPSKMKSIESHDEISFPAWESLYQACDKFDPIDRNYVLLIDAERNIDPDYLKSLGIPNWDLIIDFDYFSVENGFYQTTFSKKVPQPNVLKINDSVDDDTFSTYKQSHYHYFINSFKGSGIPSIRDYDAWQKYENLFDKFIQQYAAKFSLNTKIVVLSESISDDHLHHVFRIFKKHFKENAEFILAVNDKTNFYFTAKKFDPKYIQTSIPEIAEGIANFSSNFGVQSPFKDKYLVPYQEGSKSEGVTGILPTEFFVTLENDFEVIHKGLDLQQQEDENPRDFLSGYKPISWFGLRHDWDKKHPSLKRFTKLVEKALINGAGKIFLYHEAGYGGSTFARRIAWEFHNEYPTLLLKSYRGSRSISKVIQLHQYTRKSILIVMEVPQAISLDEVDSFYKNASSGNGTRPIVFLIVKRGSANPSEAPISDWGNNVIDLVTAYKPFLKEYNNPLTEKEKEKELSEICLGNEGFKKTPFYVGLVTFEERFSAIKDYIRKFVNDLKTEEQRKIIAYLAIVHDYLGESLPSTFFTHVVKETNNKSSINLESYLPNDFSSLIVSKTEGKQKLWQPRHVLFSKELKQQILGGDTENSNWNLNLVEYSIKFIEDSITEGQNSERVQNLLQSLFIGTRKERANEAFTPIVNDIKNEDDKERLFKCLKESYPENPHFCSHLARFYAYFKRNRDKAIQYSDEAIRLSINEGNEDALLHHIKGMCLREAATDLMKFLEDSKRKGNFIHSDRILEVIEKLVPEAAAEFELSREVSKRQGRLDEHGYVAHIQMLIQALDFGAIMSGKSKSEFLAENQEPYAGWLDLAETLLEEVKRISLEKDESSKINECEDRINGLYERYDLILQSLNNQLEKGKNLSRTRRQIVRTYFKKENATFKDNPKIINRVLNLMEENIASEPTNEKNYFLWFQAARYSNISLEDAVSKLARWKANSSAIDVTYYFYILKVFRALQGYTDDLIQAEQLIKECKTKVPNSHNITIPFEWYGKGASLQKMVSRSSLQLTDIENRLELVQGYFTKFIHDGFGVISIADKLEVFFSPAQAKLTQDDLYKEVEFYLGFSYDGLRADSHSVRVAGTQLRQVEDNYSTNSIADFTDLTKPQDLDKAFSSEQANQEKKLGLKVVGKIELDSKTRSKPTFKNNRLSGIIIDLKYPPKYVMGFVQSDEGKKYFFHKDNENSEIFNRLAINQSVTFDLSENERGLIARNISINE